MRIVLAQRLVTIGISSSFSPFLLLLPFCFPFLCDPDDAGRRKTRVATRKKSAGHLRFPTPLLPFQHDQKTKQKQIPVGIQIPDQTSSPEKYPKNSHGADEMMRTHERMQMLSDANA